MRLHVTSEIGKLKSVLVHLPGREIDVMIPPMMTQLLFDDILHGQAPREEHPPFQQIIRFAAPEVYDIQDLLEEVLADDDVKARIIRDFAARARLPRRVASALREKRAAALAEVLIGGITNEKNGSGELPAFDLYPVPNDYLMRKPQSLLGNDRVVIGLSTQARQHTALLTQYDLNY